MLEGALKLDYAGIIALEKETEAEYIRRGNNMLGKADEMGIDENFQDNFWYRHIKPKGRIGFPAEVSENMETLFGLNPSWIPVYRMGWWPGTTGCCLGMHSGGSRVPVIFYHRFLFNGYSTIQHEAIHAVRKFVAYSRFKMFEEAMADYNELALWHNKFMPSLRIRKARKRLEDRFGDKAGHILIRLTPPEVYAIASSKEPVNHLKEWGTLRHHIIRERLGL